MLLNLKKKKSNKETDSWFVIIKGFTYASLEEIQNLASYSK